MDREAWWVIVHGVAKRHDLVYRYCEVFFFFFFKEVKLFPCIERKISPVFQLLIGH